MLFVMVWLIAREWKVFVYVYVKCVRAGHFASTVNRTRGLKIFSLALSQLSYRGNPVSHKLSYTLGTQHCTQYRFIIHKNTHTSQDWTFYLTQAKLYQQVILLYTILFIITHSAIEYNGCQLMVVGRLDRCNRVWWTSDYSGWKTNTHPL